MSRLYSSQAPPQVGEFNEMRERSLLRHVISTSTEGDPDSVTAAMDSFWDTYFNGEGTAEWQVRGSALDQAVSSKKPTLAMEIGAYCGYTAVRMGRLIPDGGKLISVEIDPLYAAIATKMVEHAGLNDRVFVEIGSIKSRLAAMQTKYGLGTPLDAVLLDHDVKDYLSDLRLLESEGLITKGTVVLCDWSLYPGSEGSDAPTDGQDFMDYLAQTGGGATARHSLRDKEVFTVSSWQGVI
jgi:catechol O-methyltransferase